MTERERLTPAADNSKQERLAHPKGLGKGGVGVEGGFMIALSREKKNLGHLLQPLIRLF